MADTRKPLPTSLAPAHAPRLISLDALRGFDMIWILGLDDLVHQVAKNFPDNRYVAAVDAQLHHVDWAGFRFYDLIFPLFLFLAGVSLAISVDRRKVRDGVGRTALHLVIRGLILYMLGVLYSGGFSKFNGDFTAALESVRWMGVLQRIAIASCIAGLLSLWLGARGLVSAFLILLISYWAMLKFIPVPEVGAGVFDEGKNFANYIDRIALPGRKYDGDHDPEGLLSTLPAIATAILGLLAGKAIFSEASNAKKVLGLLISGAALIGLGWAWNIDFPVIKKIWSSSFVLVAGGWSLVLLGVFYGLIDALGVRFWAAPFVWIGANPISLYIASGLGFFGRATDLLVGSPPPPYEWVPAAVTLLLVLATARWLHRRGIYIRA